MRQINLESPGWFLACTSNYSQKCHLFTVKLGEGEFNQPKTISTLSWIGSKVFTGIKYFRTEGSFNKFVIKGSGDSSKLCFLRGSKVYVIDEAKGAPKHFRGALPNPDELEPGT